MSFKAIVEFIVHIENFRNIDLFQQGLYHLRVVLYHEQNNERIFSIPYNYTEGKSRSKRQKVSHCIMPAHILDHHSAFVSKTFLIRFCEEEVSLSDICHFRTELEAFPIIAENQVFMEVELMFAEVGNSNKFSKGKVAKEDTDFNCVSIYKAKINNIFQGVHEFVPIIFDEQHFCLSEMTFHATLFDFRFMLSSMEISDVEKVDENMEPIQNKNIEQNNNEQQRMVPKKKIFQPKSFKQFIEWVTEGFQPNLLENLYLVYGKSVRNSYKNMLNHYQMIYQKVNEKQQNLFKEEDLLDLPQPTFIQDYKKKNQDQEKEFRVEEETTIFSNTKNQDTNESKSDNKINENSDSDDGEEDKFMAETEELKENELNIKEKLKINDKKPFNSEYLKLLKISEAYNLKDSKEQEAMANGFLMDLNIIAGSMFQIVHKYIEFIILVPRLLIDLFKDNYTMKMKERWGESVFRSCVETTDLTAFSDCQTGRKNKNIAKILRKKPYYRNLDPLNIEDLSMFPSAQWHPIVFQEIYTLKSIVDPLVQNQISGPRKRDQTQGKSTNKKKEQGVHLTVMVHGFQGNNYDMRLLRNNLQILYPENLYLSSSINEEDTEGDIQIMGQNLAKEVKNFIAEWCPKNSLGKLSFIGHSLGGIIIRTALPYLEEYKDKMYCYMSLSSAHLGFMYSKSTLIDAGLWFLKRWRKSLCLKQLTMDDNKNIENCFLYQLSSKPGLGWFENIVLLSSHQDTYSPFESSRIQQCKSAQKDLQKGMYYQQMAENLLNNLKCEKIHRIDVNFQLNKGLDNMIGRAAHIQFLENQTLMRMLIYTFEHFFN